MVSRSNTQPFDSALPVADLALAIRQRSCRPHHDRYRRTVDISTRRAAIGYLATGWGSAELRTLYRPARAPESGRRRPALPLEFKRISNAELIKPCDCDAESVTSASALVGTSTETIAMPPSLARGAGRLHLRILRENFLPLGSLPIPPGRQERVHGLEFRITECHQVSTNRSTPKRRGGSVV